MPATNRVLLRQRPLDAFYLVYFAFHILTFICIDGQNFYPEALVPATLKRVMSDYLRDSGDPFVKGLQAGDPRYTWFATSMYSSLVFQNPVFVAGIVCLWRGEPWRGAMRAEGDGEGEAVVVCEAKCADPSPPFVCATFIWSC